MNSGFDCFVAAAFLSRLPAPVEVQLQTHAQILSVPPNFVIFTIECKG